MLKISAIPAKVPSGLAFFSMDLATRYQKLVAPVNQCQTLENFSDVINQNEKSETAELFTIPVLVLVSNLNWMSSARQPHIR